VIEIVRAPIRVEALIDAVRGDADGAVALFVGTVREHNAGRHVLRLEYQAYDEMALAEMRRLAEATREQFAVSGIAIVHRVGVLEIGEASVAIAVAAAHRGAALDACRHAIDTLKRTVPIWKKESFEGGEVWIEGQAGDGPPDQS